MTIQIPTNNPNQAGLPDQESLNRLAGELFAMLPGEPQGVAQLLSGLAPRSLTVLRQAGLNTGFPVDISSGISTEPASGLTLKLTENVPIILPETASADTPDAYYFLEYARTNSASNQRDFSSQHVAFQSQAPFDIHAVRRDFPILSERVNGRPLVWFDNAATMQKPQVVIDRISAFYAHENSNIHRAAHELAARATDAYENARNIVTRFIGARSSSEIIFVRGTTEGINLIAQTFGKQHIGAGDEIIVSHLEHHANIVPWQLLAEQTGAKLRVIPVDDSGQIILSEYSKLLNSRTRLVSVTQVSNALGTVTPIREIIDLGHRAGARVMIDGAQGISHMPVNVRQLDADFYVFSGHKIVGPTGIGVVYGKQELLDQLPPWQGGGNMIADVTFEKTVFQAIPNKFEAGTGNIANAAGLGAAIDYLDRVGIADVSRHEHVSHLRHSGPGENSWPSDYRHSQGKRRRCFLHHERLPH